MGATAACLAAFCCFLEFHAALRSSAFGERPPPMLGSVRLATLLSPLDGITLRAEMEVCSEFLFNFSSFLALGYDPLLLEICVWGLGRSRVVNGLVRASWRHSVG